MLNFLNAFQAPAYAMLRIVSGFMFSFHGVQKILGLFTDRPTPAFGTQAWVGGMIELLGGILVMLGLATRPAAFISSGTMAVAYIQFHWKMQMGEQFLPVINRGELAALYCFVFFFIAAQGQGIWSMDKKA